MSDNLDFMINHYSFCFTFYWSFISQYGSTHRRIFNFYGCIEFLFTHNTCYLFFCLVSLIPGEWEPLYKCLLKKKVPFGTFNIYRTSYFQREITQYYYYKIVGFLGHTLSTFWRQKRRNGFDVLMTPIENTKEESRGSKETSKTCKDVDLSGVFS